MMLAAELRRFCRHRVNLWVLAAFAVVVTLGALASGLAATEHRRAVVAQQERWAAEVAATRVALLLEGLSDIPADGAKRAMTAFSLGRHDDAVAHLPAREGLALSVRQFDRLSPELRVSVESRHSDARKNDVLTNPLLDGMGALDFATLIALLLPLALIGLIFGLVHEDREQGIWRLVCVQSGKVGALVLIGLAIRAASVAAIVAAGSVLVFALDSGSSLHALFTWLAVVLAYTLCWTAWLAACLLLPVSSGTSTLAMLGLWLMLTFAVPGVLASVADRQSPMPSRLDAIFQMREAQQQAEVDMDALVAEWYRQHPEAAEVASRPHTWPMTFVPRFLAQDRQVRPLMRQFDAARARQVDMLESHAWLSPPLAMLLAADRLAGIDAPRYLRYVDAVNAFEDEWRGFLVPRIMAYRGLDAADLDRLPVFGLAEDDTVRWPPSLWGMLAVALAGWAIFGVGRRALGRP